MSLRKFLSLKIPNSRSLCLEITCHSFAHSLHFMPSAFNLLLPLNTFELEHTLLNVCCLRPLRNRSGLQHDTKSLTGRFRSRKKRLLNYHYVRQKLNSKIAMLQIAYLYFEKRNTSKTTNGNILSWPRPVIATKFTKNGRKSQELVKVSARERVCS